MLFRLYVMYMLATLSAEREKERGGKREMREKERGGLAIVKYKVA